MTMIIGTSAADAPESVSRPADPADLARPFLRRDTFYAETESGIQFASAGATFQLTGSGAFQVFERMAPFLDGEISGADLRAALANHWPVIEAMLGHLTERGFVRWISQAVLPSQPVPVGWVGPLAASGPRGCGNPAPNARLPPPPRPRRWCAGRRPC